MLVLTVKNDFTVKEKTKQMLHFCFCCDFCEKRYFALVALVTHSLADTRKRQHARVDHGSYIITHSESASS
jgi:hypothetical protein